jgi:alpha-ribazole phosphatase
MRSVEALSRALFIRHAETEMAGRFCGHSDPELNAKGQAQALALAEELSAEAIDIVYSSDLRRARSTAEAITERRGIPLVVIPALREVDFGKWEGLEWREIENSDYAANWVASFPDFPAPEGERFQDFEARVLAAVNSLLNRNGGPFAVVTHAGVLRVVLRRLYGCSEEEAWRQTQSYCSVVRYEFEAIGERR